MKTSVGLSSESLLILLSFPFHPSLANVKFIQEKRLITKFFEEVAQDSGKYVFGVTDTLQVRFTYLLIYLRMSLLLMLARSLVQIKLWD